ncbi:MAG: DUF4197 domain-containing protein [Pseudomonadota bacterium]
MSLSRHAKLFIPLYLAASAALALSLSDLSNQEAGGGLKAALEHGSLAAVGKLGAENGFLNNDKVRIPLPRLLEQARPLLKMSGRGAQLDELEVAMNHAAEAAVPLAKPLLIDAVKTMTISDARQILSGGETSVTDFFRDKTSSKLAVKFLPIVKQVTDRSGLTAKYNGAMAQVSKLGLVKQQATVEDYVTQRTLAGLFTMIGEEEKAIRADPLGTGSKLIGKVFGALR